MKVKCVKCNKMFETDEALVFNKCADCQSEVDILSTIFGDTIGKEPNDVA